VVGDNLEVVRTPASLPELSRVAAEEGVIFAGAAGGGYVFPEFLPAYDAMASLCKLLELLAKYEAQPLSQIAGSLPRQTLIHREVACPWALKGTVMRVLNERFTDADVDLRDGIKVSTTAAGSRSCRTPTSRSSTSTQRARRRSPELEQESTLVTELVEQEEVGSRARSRARL
jgi:phosphomannomutase